MDITSIAPAVFALTIFLISVAATLAASVISKRVLAEQAEAYDGFDGNTGSNAAPALRSKQQYATLEHKAEERQAA